MHLNGQKGVVAIERTGRIAQRAIGRKYRYLPTTFRHRDGKVRKQPSANVRVGVKVLVGEQEVRAAQHVITLPHSRGRFRRVLQQRG